MLTEQQIKQLRAKHNIPEQGLGASSTQKSPEEAIARRRLLAAEYDKSREEPKSRFSETMEDIKQIGSSIKSRFIEGADKIAEIKGTKAKGEQGALQSGLQAFGVGAGIASGAIGDIFTGVIKGALSQDQEDAVKSKVEETATSVMENPLVGDSIKASIEAFKNLDENTQRNLEALFNTGMLALDVATLGGGKKLAEKGIETGIDVLQKGKTAIGEGIETITDIGKDIVDKRIKLAISRLNPKDAESAINSINKAYKTSFIEDSVSINRKLTKLANRSGKSSDELVNDLAREGIIPDVEGKLAKFDTALADLSASQKSLRNRIKKILPNFTETRNLDEIKKMAEDNLRKFGNAAELDKSLSELGKKIESIKTKYGDKINPSQLDEIRVDMNALTKSYKGEVFTEDVANAIADSARKIMDDIIPDKAYRKANAELQRLITLENTIKIFDNTPINIGALGGEMGRFIATIGASGAGLSVAGPGGLVLAGIVAKYGGDIVAKFLRNKKFNREAADLIKKSLKENPDVLDNLIKESNEANAKYLKTLLLPEPSYIEATAKTPSKSYVKGVQAKKTYGKDIETGKFKRVYTTEQK